MPCCDSPHGLVITERWREPPLILPLWTRGGEPGVCKVGVQVQAPLMTSTDGGEKLVNFADECLNPSTWPSQTQSWGGRSQDGEGMKFDGGTSAYMSSSPYHIYHHTYITALALGRAVQTNTGQGAGCVLSHLSLTPTL